MIKTICDRCGREASPCVVGSRVWIYDPDSSFKLGIMVEKGNIANSGNLCKDCLVSMLAAYVSRHIEKTGT